MPLKGCLVSHLICLVYITYLWKIQDPENHNVSGKVDNYSFTFGICSLRPNSCL